MRQTGKKVGAQREGSSSAPHSWGLALRATGLEEELVDQQGVAVWIRERDVRRAISVGLGVRRQLDACVEEPLTDFPHVRELGELFLLLSEPRIEGHDILVEHPLEETDDGDAVHNDRVVLTVAAGDLEVELLVEVDGDAQVLDGQADRERAEAPLFPPIPSRPARRPWPYAAFFAASPRLFRSLKRINS